MSDPDDTPKVAAIKAVRSTASTTNSGTTFTTHQGEDRRWYFRINGKNSERTYPTAGEAERGAISALRAEAKNRPEPWKWWLIVAVALAPIIYFIWTLVRMMTDH